MKKTGFAIVLIALLASSTASYSQVNMEKYGPNAAECLKYLDYYQEYYKQKNYDAATPNWREAYKVCPVTCSQNMLINGAYLMKRLITKNAANKTYKNALVDSLMTLYDQRAANYPKYTVKALNDKGKDLFNYVKNDPEKLFNGLEDVINRNKEKTSYTLYLFDLNAAISLYQKGGLDVQKAIDVYQRNSTFLENSVPANETEAAQKEKIKTDMGNIFASSNIADCTKLQEIFTPMLNADPDNLGLIKSIVKTLGSVDDCQSNDLFLKAVSSMHRLEPSGRSAYYLYKLNSASDNVDNAIKYLEEAIASEETDASTDAEYTYELATYCYKNGRTAKAYEVASKIPALNEAYAGKAYFLMGNIWGATTCGGDEINKRAQYWVAVDYMNKARNADPSLAEEAGSRIANYSRYFPQQGDAFFYGISDGQSYTVTCGGMRAVTTVRTVK